MVEHRRDFIPLNIEVIESLSQHRLISRHPTGQEVMNKLITLLGHQLEIIPHSLNQRILTFTPECEVERALRRFWQLGLRLLRPRFHQHIAQIGFDKQPERLLRRLSPIRRSLDQGTGAIRQNMHGVAAFQDEFQ